MEEEINQIIDIKEKYDIRYPHFQKIISKVEILKSSLNLKQENPDKINEVFDKFKQKNYKNNLILFSEIEKDEYGNIKKSHNTYDTEECYPTIINKKI